MKLENLERAIAELGDDKKVDKDVLIAALEQAMLAAAKKCFGENREMEAKYNPETGVELKLIIHVVEDDAIQGREITLEEAHGAGLEAELRDELLFPVFYMDHEADEGKKQDEKFGDLIDLKNAHRKFGRIAAQTARQVIIQRIREAERDAVYNEYKDRKGEIITGTVSRFERGALMIRLSDKTEAVLPMREQVPRESFRVGDSIRALLLDIDRNARGPQIVLSRAHKGFVEKLFEKEVAEIADGTLRIEASAREPGVRTKIAVASRHPQVKALGTAIGRDGRSAQAVMQELRGEKVDIIQYNEDPAQFVLNAIHPAEPTRVIIDGEDHRMELIVPDHMLSLAIGKKGQNVKLASRLTGWKIHIHSESKIFELERRAKDQMAAVEGVGRELAETLFKLGWRSVQELAGAHVDELGSVPSVGSPARAAEVVAAAREFLSHAAENQGSEEDRRAHLSGEEQLLEISGIDEELLTILAQANVRSPQDLVKVPIEEVASVTGIEMSDLARLRQRAMSWLSEVA